MCHCDQDSNSSARHPVVQAIDEAREILRGTRHHRLTPDQQYEALEELGSLNREIAFRMTALGIRWPAVRQAGDGMLAWSEVGALEGALTLPLQARLSELSTNETKGTDR